MLKPYLFASAALLFSFGIFFFARRLTAAFRPGYQELVRSAQGLVLFSILLPLLAGALPRQAMPEIRMPSFWTGEGHEGLVMKMPKKASALSPFAPPAPPAVLAAPAMLETATWFRRTELVSYVLSLFWAVGFFICACRLHRNRRRLGVLLAASHPLRITKRAKVVISEKVTVPFSAFALGHRWVVLPAALIRARGDFRLALKHELQHLRQGDTYWAIAMEWLVCAFFWHPAIYLWRREIIELQEFSCDEALVGQPGVSSLEYGSCLLRVAETALGGRRNYAGTTYMANAKSPTYLKSFLRRRIEMLLHKKRSRPWMGALIGTAGVIATLSLAYGMEKTARQADVALPNPGKLVVDKDIQRITQKILADAVERHEAAEGFAVVADPQTGRILAVANVDTKKKKTGNWVLSQLIEPASIAKTMVVAEAIENGKTTPEETIPCGGAKYKYKNKTFHDWKDGGLGPLTTTQAVAMSSDICTLKIAERLGDEGIRNLLEKYGFGPEGTARSFPESRAGMLPPKEGEVADYLVPFVVYGQGFRSNVIELMQAYGAIANGGNLLMPQAANSNEKQVVRRVMSPETAAKMKTILREVVLSGTGKRNAGSYLYTTAGKTASGYSPDDTWLETSRGTRKANLAGFIGFAPLENPRVEVYVGIKDPGAVLRNNSGAHGAEHAAPVFRQIADAVLQQMKVSPDNL